MASFSLNSSTIGVDLNNASSTALFAVGTHVLGSQGTEWVYVQANTSIVGQRMVAYQSGTFTCGMASGGDLVTTASSSRARKPRSRRRLTGGSASVVWR